MASGPGALKLGAFPRRASSGIVKDFLECPEAELPDQQDIDALFEAINTLEIVLNERGLAISPEMAVRIGY